MQKLKPFAQTSLKKAKKQWQKFLGWMDKRPLATFGAVLALLVTAIVVGNWLRKPVINTDSQKEEPKLVQVISVGNGTKLQFSGKVEKSGALQVSAASGGYLQKLFVQPGTAVKKGQKLAWISSTVSGGTAASISRQLAQKNWELVEANYPTQMDMLKLRRETAEKVDAQGDQLREITKQSLDDTRNTIAVNEDILKTLESQIKTLETSGDPASNAAALQQAKQGKAGILSALGSLRNALRNSEYQANGDKEPARLGDLSKDIAMKQLEIEERSINLSKEVSLLNLRLAQIGEAAAYPAAPCTGTVERVYAKLGQSVNPGAPLFALSCEKNSGTVIVSLPGSLADRVSRMETSSLSLNGQSVEALPTWVSTEPTEGIFHSVTYQLSQELADSISNGSFVSVLIPLSGQQTSAAFPTLPLDALYQTASETYVFVATQQGEENVFTAQTRKITVGNVIGGAVEVLEGIESGDQVILDRSIVSGDQVRIQ